MGQILDEILEWKGPDGPFHSCLAVQNAEAAFWRAVAAVRAVKGPDHSVPAAEWAAEWAAWHGRDRAAYAAERAAYAALVRSQRECNDPGCPASSARPAAGQ